jgi:segregation and condensation protein B
MEIRGVQGAGVLKTLLDRKLITESGRKKVIGQPILYKTTKDFLVQFGLASISELPTLKEFEELGRMELVEEIAEAAEAAADLTPEAPEVTGLIETEAPETAPSPDSEPVAETETVAGAEEGSAEESKAENA